MGWIIKTDAAQPWAVARHWGTPGEGDRSVVACGVQSGRFRELEEDELVRYRPCGRCIVAEHDGPYDNAVAASEAVRNVATAAGKASMDLDDLGYHRLARNMKTIAAALWESAQRAEPESEGEE